MKNCFKTLFFLTALSLVAFVSETKAQEIEITAFLGGQSFNTDTSTLNSGPMNGFSIGIKGDQLTGEWFLQAGVNYASVFPPRGETFRSLQYWGALGLVSNVDGSKFDVGGLIRVDYFNDLDTEGNNDSGGIALMVDGTLKFPELSNHLGVKLSGHVGHTFSTIFTTFGKPGIYMGGRIGVVWYWE